MRRRLRALLTATAALLIQMSGGAALAQIPAPPDSTALIPDSAATAVADSASAAQEPPDHSASAFVPPGHWSVEAVNRLHALGLTPPGIHRGERSRTIREVRWALVEAERRSAAGRTGWGELARGYLQRFDGEFRTVRTGDVALSHASLSGGLAMLRGDASPGNYTDWGEQHWTGAVAREDRTSPAGAGAASVELGRHFAAGMAATGGAYIRRIEEAYGTARLGPFGLWGGRRVLGYGSGTSGVTLSGTAPIDGVGLFLAEPLLLPSVLRYLGPIRVEGAISVLDANGPVERPLFITTHFTLEPHPRFGVGATRGAMLAMREGGYDMGDVMYVFVGGQAKGSEYDNQVVSVDGWFRPPLGPLPLLLYLDWGSEDAAGAWWDVPGITLGAEIAAVPGLPWLSLLVERTNFPGSRKGNPPWYRHPIGFHEGWSAHGELLGHPLGGHGEEWLAEAHSSTHDARLQLALRGFSRMRREENVYAPERAGRSWGTSLGADYQFGEGLAVRVFGSLEQGASHWTRKELVSALRLHLPRR